MDEKIGTCLTCSAPLTEESGYLTSEASRIGHHNSQDRCLEEADKHIRKLHGLLATAYGLLEPVAPAWSGVRFRQDWIERHREWQRDMFKVAAWDPELTGEGAGAQTDQKELSDG